MADTSIRTYRAKRNFATTAEPPPNDAPRPEAATSAQPIFVVQKHAAHRAGLHYDFRLEHDGVLWSWAVPKGPSLDPAERRIAIHVEDHPIEYAAFQGEIPAGQYGGGAVSTWDRGTWSALEDPDAGMAKGNLRFTLEGGRLQGRFTLARLKNRARGRQEGWFLIKGHDEFARDGIGAPELEAEAPVPDAPAQHGGKPAPAAVRGAMPAAQSPQLCSLTEQAPEGDDWLNEIKFDGYRILAEKDGEAVRLLTRNGLDWAPRMPAVAAAIAALPVQAALIDGELVALDAEGASSFPYLQDSLKNGRDDTLVFYAFDLLHLDGWDLRPAPLLDRKAALARLPIWSPMIRLSEHVVGTAAAVHAQAGKLGLEGIICKRAADPYRPGRGGGWLKLKCLGREEFVVVGWTPPAGSREGFGALHLGYHDEGGTLQYAGGVGTGFDAKALRAIRKRLDALAADAPPAGLAVSGDPVDRAVTWLRPELVAEVKYTGWSGAGRVRHAVFLGLREDKPAEQVVRPLADPDSPRIPIAKAARGAPRRGWHGAIPPMPKEPLVAPEPEAKPRVVRAKPAAAKAADAATKPDPKAPVEAPVKPPVRIVRAKKPAVAKLHIGSVDISHPNRELWPGITKQHLAEYWGTVAEHALPGLAHRPLSILRCPEGVTGEQFFQKNGHGFLPHQIREGKSGTQPFLAIDDADGLFALAQMSAIELHPWGAPESDPTRPDRLVFDLDPGEGVPFAEVVQAAHDVRARLQAIGLASLCRTTGGKGLHVVVPLRPGASWAVAKPFCRAFAETMAQDEPARFLAHLKIADRTGRILIDWLRNGLGSTAVSSYCPRARPGAPVATPLDWAEVVPKLDPAAFTVLTVPRRLAKLKTDPWAELARIDQVLPDLSAPAVVKPGARPTAKPRTPTRIVTASKPKPRASTRS